MELARNLPLETKKSFEDRKIDELREKLKGYEETGIGYPFDFNVVETLHQFQHEPAIAKLIAEKQNALKIILEGIENEKALGYYRNWKRENDAYIYLKDLIGDTKK